jgi:hypothetical protein
MIEALIAGHSPGAPTMRTAANSRIFTAVRISAADQTGAFFLVSCVAFNASAIESVQRITDGDNRVP